MWPIDLLIVDLKMPPGEWGGLWLLEQLQNQGQRVPSFVLSGEGWGVREAFRLGAVDYIEKTEAAQDLFSRCAETVDKFQVEALDKAGKELPTPLAYRFARYESTADPDKKLLEGLLAVEEILRFGSIIGLSSTEPVPLRGINRQQISSLSMGTWLDLCIALANIPTADVSFTQFWSWLAPKKSDRDLVRSLVRLRNDIAHGRPPDHTMSALLEHLLRRFTHRALGLWRAELAVPQAMSYNGHSFEATYSSITGLGPPKYGTIRTTKPLTTGHPVLLSPTRQPLSLTPWLVARTDEATGSVRCLQFDGTVRRPGSDNTVPLRYTPTDGHRDDTPTDVPGGGCWGDLEPWAADSG
ncbi:Response regulator receiver domain-containing protein [Actinokineospora iranica]|uniref:Response regulator receiver domain-containing protein n=2 Tax=Actinokineospora iranica TaxID=1271860 RepID=A0A1G6VRK4_9PSEU|nr:Response regulator receiver domain-containing protein [Actinokineospora iranica]